MLTEVIQEQKANTMRSASCGESKKLKFTEAESKMQLPSLGLVEMGDEDQKNVGKGHRISVTQYNKHKRSIMQHGKCH